MAWRAEMTPAHTSSKEVHMDHLDLSSIPPMDDAALFTMADEQAMEEAAAEAANAYFAAREDASYLEASFAHYEDHMVGACSCECENDRTCTHIA